MNAKFSKMDSRPHSRGERKLDNIRNRSCRKICLLFLITSVLVSVVAGLSIHVLQIRQSLNASDQKYQRLWEQHQEMNRTLRQCRLQLHEPYSTLEPRTSKDSRQENSQESCLQNVSVPDSNVSILESKLLALESNHSILEFKLFALQRNLSVLSADLSAQHQTQTDLRHNLSHLELKYRTLNETKAAICQLLTNRKDGPCYQDWIRNEDRCYFISAFKSSYDGAKETCSSSESMLLEINSQEEENFVTKAFGGQESSYWIGKCKAGEAAPNLFYKMNAGRSKCSEWKAGWLSSCNDDHHRFICEMSAPSCPDIPEKVLDLCQKPLAPTSI